MRQSDATDGRVGNYLPLAIFGAVYVLTCLIGAIVLIVNYRPFVALWEYFSGTTEPVLSGAQLAISATLLLIPPLLLAAGYWLGRRIPIRTGARGSALASALRRPTSGIAAQVIFYLLAAIGVTSLARAGSFAKLDSWLSYQAWVDARWSAFASMSFFEFVNLYTFVPLAAAWCALVTPGGNPRREAVRWAPLVISILLTLALFQEKAALIVLILVLSAFLLDLSRRRPSLVRRGVMLGVASLTLGYFAMVVLPTFNLAVHNEPALQRARAALVTPKPPAVPPPSDLTAPAPVVPDAAEREPTTVVDATPSAPQVDPRIGVAIYSMLAPLMRTSAPALYYPIVFPEIHGFYGPDLGQDIVCSRKIGCSGLRMPDDNLVVWDYMNPALHGGSITAPFQFALYSQAGLAGAFVGSVVLGFVLALAWRLARSAATPPLWSSLLGAVVVLLAVNLALDSPRNSIVVTYGALWGFVFIAALAAGVIVARRRFVAPALQTDAALDVTSRRLV